MKEEFRRITIMMKIKEIRKSNSLHTKHQLSFLKSACHVQECSSTPTDMNCTQLRQANELLHLEPTEPNESPLHPDKHISSIIQVLSISEQSHV